MIAKHHEGRWTKIVSNWNPAVSTKQKGYCSTSNPYPHQKMFWPLIKSGVTCFPTPENYPHNLLILV